MTGSRRALKLSLTLIMLFSTAASRGWDSLTTSCGPVEVSNSTLKCCLCDDSRVDWFSNNIVSNISFSISMSRIYATSYSKWEYACSWAHGVLGCMRDKIPGCTDDHVGEKLMKQLNDNFTGNMQFVGLIVNIVYCGPCGPPRYSLVSWTFLGGFYGQVCENGQINPEILKIVSEPSVNLTCVEPRLYRDVGRCLLSGKEIRQSSLSVDSADQVVESIAQAGFECMNIVINRALCNTPTKKVLYQAAKLKVSSAVHNGKVHIDESITENFRSKARCTVGVYGVTHFKTCWPPHSVTCFLPGEQTYFRNKFLVIKGTNVEIGLSTTRRATSLKSVSIQFFSLDGNSIATYSAKDGSLSTTFDDVTDTKIGTDTDGVEILPGSNNNIYFVQKPTRAVLILNQWSGNYLFTLRMADNVIIVSSGLLIDGCPSNQILTKETFLDIELHSGCETSCNRFNDTELQACVIDCLAIQDTEFAIKMAEYAKEDELYALEIENTVLGDDGSSTGDGGADNGGGDRKTGDGGADNGGGDQKTGDGGGDNDGGDQKTGDDKDKNGAEMSVRHISYSLTASTLFLSFYIRG